MDITKVKAIPEKHRMSVHLTIRVSPDIKNWLVNNHFSPTLIFHEAIKDLGYKGDNGVELAPVDVDKLEELPVHSSNTYFVKQSVKTKHGLRTVLVQQSKPYGHGKGDVRRQRRRWKAKNRRNRWDWGR